MIGARRIWGYAAVFLVALVARVSLTLLPVSFITPGQERLWSWAFFAVFTGCFVLGALFAERAGLPSPDRLRGGASVGLPIGIGLLVALATAISDVLHPAAAARGLNELHIRGPAAIPFYLYGAVLLTVVFHFLPVAAGAWVARRAGLRARRAVLALTVLAVGFSEDLTFFTKPDDWHLIETARHVLSVLANSSEALLILRFGLLAGLLQRGSTYLVWHLVWPAIA